MPRASNLQTVKGVKGLFQRLTRRNLLIVGLGSIAGVALAACGASPAEPTSSGSSSAAPTAAPPPTAASSGAAAQPTQASAPAVSKPASGATVTLRQMRFAGVGWEQDVSFAADFAKKNPNIKVVGEDTPYGQMNQKVLTSGAAGTIGDLFPGHVRWTAYWEFKGICLELDPLVKAYPDETKFDDFFPSVIKDARGPGADGKLFIFPTIVHPGGNAIIMINEDLITGAGLKVPTSNDWTIKDLEELARGAGKPKDGIWGLQTTMNSPLYSTQITRGWSKDKGPPAAGDSWVLSPDGKKSQLGSGPVKEAFEWTQKLVKDGFSPTSQDALPGTTGDLFTAGKVVLQSATIGQPQADHDIIGDKFKWSALLWPLGPNGCRGTCLSYNTWSISSKVKNPDEAFHLLNALTGTEAGTWAAIQGHAVPYARHSVWSNPDLWKAYPIDQAGLTVFEAGVDPFPMPENLRAQEYQDTFQQNIQAYLDGKQTWDDMYTKTNNAVQAILDEPKP